MLDQFKKYYSSVGNSDVPYPILVGSEYVYFMLDGVYKMIPSKIGYIEDKIYCGNYIPVNCDNIVHSFKLLEYRIFLLYIVVINF